MCSTFTGASSSFFAVPKGSPSSCRNAMPSTRSDDAFDDLYAGGQDRSNGWEGVAGAFTRDSRRSTVGVFILGQLALSALLAMVFVVAPLYAFRRRRIERLHVGRLLI